MHLTLFYFTQPAKKHCRRMPSDTVLQWQVLYLLLIDLMAAVGAVLFSLIGGGETYYRNSFVDTRLADSVLLPQCHAVQRSWVLTFPAFPAVSQK